MPPHFLRDSVAGQIVRCITGNRVLLYADELNAHASSVDEDWSSPIIPSPTHDEQDTHMSYAFAVNTGIPSKTVSVAMIGVMGPDDVEETSLTWTNSYDPDNPYNWSTIKKVFVASQIWLALCLAVMHIR